MFYSDDILKKRGKFGLIWLAATGKKLTRRDVWSVDIKISSDNVIDVLKMPYALEHHRNRYSLYLCSQLMYGLAKVQSRRCQFVYEDAKSTYTRLYAFRTPIETSIIDLPPSTDHLHLILPSPNMSDVSPGFGRLAPSPEPAQHENINFFLVTTPQSSEEELLLTPPGGILAPLPPMPEGAELLHTSARTDITMEEPVQQVQQEDPFGAPDEGNVDLLTGPMGFLVPGDMLEPPTREEILEEPQPFPPHSPSPFQRPSTPQDGALRSPQEPIARVSGSPEGQGPPDVPGTFGSPIPLPPPPMSPDRPRRRRPPPVDENEFVLDPVVQPGPRRRRRRRHLVVDRVTVISPDEMRNRMRVQVDNDELFRRFREELTRPRRLTVAELLGRFNTRVVPAPFHDVFRRLRTLPEPNFQIEDEEEEPPAVEEEPPVNELPVLDQEPPIVEQLVQEQPTDEIFENEPVEMRRAGETFERTMDPSVGRMVTSSSLRVPDASSATLHGTRDFTASPGRPSMLNVEDDIGLLSDLDLSRRRVDRLEDLREAQIGEEIRQPEEDIEMAGVSEHEEIPTRTTVPVCHYSPVSPERISPPSSYESLTEPLQSTLDFIKEHARNGVLYFEELIEKELTGEREDNKVTTKSVAILFNFIIHLAKEKKIELEQIVPFYSILIKLP